MKRKIRMGMIGGGPGSFIGKVHRMASRLDGLVELVCGVFSNVEEEVYQLGHELFISDDRLYPSYKEMIKKESELPEGERMDFVSIVTPNFLHFEPAKLALEAGFDVVLEKPMTLTLEEAVELRDLVEETGLQLCLMHAYTGYPMVKQAKEMIKEGKLGKIRKVYVEYPQGWLSLPIENTGSRQAEWRLDPEKGGIGGCIGDIGTHSANLAEYVTGLKIEKVNADINQIVEGRQLDDDNALFLKLEGGASGVIMASQIAIGEENGLKIRVYGDKASLKWEQEDANSLILKYLDKPSEIIRTGGPGNTKLALHNQRIPAGHPEGFIEAFANLYRNFVLTIAARKEGTEPQEEWLDFPGVKAGVRGILFVKKAIESGNNEKKWVNL